MGFNSVRQTLATERPFTGLGGLRTISMVSMRWLLHDGGSRRIFESNISRVLIRYVVAPLTVMYHTYRVLCRLIGLEITLSMADELSMDSPSPVNQ